MIKFIGLLLALMSIPAYIVFTIWVTGKVYSYSSVLASATFAGLFILFIIGFLWVDKKGLVDGNA